MGRRIVALVGVGGVLTAAVAFAAAPSRLYTAAATEACLTNVPDAIVGLPPADPPRPPALFVYSFPRQRLLPHVHAELGAWYGFNNARGYDGVTLSFFTSVPRARAAFKPQLMLYGGKRIRNVVVEWDSSRVPKRSLQRTVLGCLRAGSGAARTPAPAPPASLATFVGYWGGHTRGLRITSGSGGRGAESVDSGCCYREYRMTFQIFSVRGTLTRATARFIVTSYKRYDRHLPKLRVGQFGTLVLKDGIVTNALTDVYFCSDPAWGATGACGA